MDVQQKLDDIVAAVENARSMPMSASCVVNRTELLDLLEEVRQALPGSLAQAQELLGGREQMVAEARQEAQRIIESARAERSSLLSDTEVVRRSREEAERILAQARQEAEGIRAEADDYVDSKLANFEVVLSKTIGSVDRGREKLLGRGPQSDPYGEEGTEDVPERSADPAELRERADAYVEAQFRAFQTVLTKTLEAVGRGRQKLTGHRPADELAAHMAAQDGGLDPHGQARSDEADYLAGLADQPAPAESPAPAAEPAAPAEPAVPAEPAAPAYEPQQQPIAVGAVGAAGPAAYDYRQDGYGYRQEYRQQDYGQVQQDAYAYAYQQQDYGQVQQDPYAYQQDYGQVQQDAYAYAYRQQDYGQVQQDPYAYQQEQVPEQPPYRPQQPGALDETSFFDTSVIDAEQLRRYEQGR